MTTYCAFTGGGTAGHIYPGLAVVDELKYIDTNLKFLWIGSSQGMDEKIVGQSGSIDIFKGILSGKLRRYFSVQNIIDIFKVFLGFVSSFFILLKYKPLFLFSKGGFVSVPPCFAAKLLGIPVYTHECDFSPGLATRLNAKFAKKIFLSYEETKLFFSNDKQSSLIVSGNPVRPVFYNADKKRGTDFLLKIRPQLEDVLYTKPLLLVIGGSLGARQINELVFENLDWLCDHCVVVHQTGRNVCLPEEYRLDYVPLEFIYTEMPDVLAAADVVLSRAGANALSEALLLEKPLILIPLAGAGTRGDQVENAEHFKVQYNAHVLLGDDVNGKTLQEAVHFFLDTENRIAYAKHIREMNIIDRPAKKIAEILFNEEVRDGKVRNKSSKE